MRVLLVDDHHLVRSGIRALLGRMPDVSDVREAGDGEEALEIVARHPIDVVVMALTMARMSGIEAMHRIHKVSPSIRVIILSAHQERNIVLEAIRAGAAGYLLKSDRAEELQAALRTVSAGDTYVSPSVKRIAGSNPRLAINLPLQKLTPRQLQTLHLIAQGLTSREISEVLGIRVKTVESHRTELMRRLGIHDVAGLVHYAIRHGLGPE